MKISININLTIIARLNLATGFTPMQFCHNSVLFKMNLNSIVTHSSLIVVLQFKIILNNKYTKCKTNTLNFI